MDALSHHVALGTASGAFIEDALQTVGSESVGNFDILLCLPFEMVKTKGFIQAVAQLLNAEVTHLFPGVETTSLGRYRHGFANLQFVV